ncbi:protein containing DUF169 [Candidatus Magnetobacterium bavaricum]|uniref:Protein containing DUF169 n=1 Tax=Candidatus Magnetobacterium bavaricum TaxID=29290 RepID=A0A0F3GRU0_9BACT|nr:protein containing DUF169 [Candidatus Magnetobacterium bavaricum]
MDYKEIQHTLMEELRLMHYPIAVKFIFNDTELEDFKNNVTYHIPVHPITFCQFEIGSRMKGQTILGTKATLGCANAQYVFGWKPLDDAEIKSHLKYTIGMEQAERFLRTKPRLPEGQLKAFVVSPLADSYFAPDVVHFYCDNMQAYHLVVDYMAAMDVHPLRPSLTMNSSACGGSVFSYNEGTLNMLTACSGSYNSGKTERGEINVMIPGGHIKQTTQRLLDRKKLHGSSSITRPGDLFPGADVCKNCPLIICVKSKDSKNPPNC